MKKLISLLIVCLCLLNINVSAATLEDATKRVMDYFKIEITEDVSGVAKLQNRRNIKNKELVSTAINSGVLVPLKGLVNESGTDFTPLTNGLIKKYIKDDNFKFLSGKQVDLVRNKNVLLNEETFFVTENFRKEDLNYEDVYTCIVDRENVAHFVWVAKDVVQPSVYKVKLYWLEGSELVVTEIYRKEFGEWIKESADKFYTFDSSEISVSTEFVLNNLDSHVYVFADNYGENVVVKGIAQ